MRESIVFLGLPSRVSPMLAFFMSLCVFFASSFVFNLTVLLFHLIGLQRFLGGLLQGVVLLALFLFAVPFAAAAGKTRGNGRPVVVAAAVFLTISYVTALYLRLSFVTDWFYPHWPGMPSDLSTGRLFGILVVGGMFFGVAYWVVNDLRAETGAGAVDSDLAGELGEGAGEGLGHQFGRHSGSRGAESSDFEGLI